MSCIVNFRLFPPHYSLARAARPANSKVTKRGTLEDQRLVRGVNETCARTLFDLSNFGDRNACCLCRRAETFSLLVRHSADYFVIVAAGESQLKRSRIACNNGLGRIRYGYSFDID